MSLLHSLFRSSDRAATLAASPRGARSSGGTDGRDGLDECARAGDEGARSREPGRATRYARALKKSNIDPRPALPSSSRFPHARRRCVSSVSTCYSRTSPAHRARCLPRRGTRTTRGTSRVSPTHPVERTPISSPKISSSRSSATASWSGATTGSSPALVSPTPFRAAAFSPKQKRNADSRLRTVLSS